MDAAYCVVDEDIKREFEMSKRNVIADLNGVAMLSARFVNTRKKNSYVINIIRICRSLFLHFTVFSDKNTRYGIELLP